MSETGKKETRRPIVPQPDRTRRLEGTRFGWIDARVLHDGWLRVLGPEAVAIYAFLCLAGNRDGVSYYRRDRVGNELGLGDDRVYAALERLRSIGLVAYRPFHVGAADGFHQVLALPAGGPSRGGRP